MTATKQRALSSTHLNQVLDPLKADFRNFLYVIWQHVLPGCNPTKVQYDIARFLQHGPKRMVIEAFRGVGKSWITSAFVCWLLYCNPQLNILVISASKQRADDFSTFTKRLIFEIDILAHLRPTGDQRNSNVAFDVGPARASHAPSVKSLGITSQIAGSRADVIIPDDVEVPNNSDTSLKREKLSEQIKEFDAVLKPGGRIIYLGTPQSEQSIYNLLPDRGYQLRIWCARYPDEARRAKYGSKLAPLIAKELDADPNLVGRTTDPERFSGHDLDERELSYGKSGFSLQFMLDTSLSDEDKYPLKLSDLIVLGLNPKKGPSEIVWAASKDKVREDLPMIGLPGDRYYEPMFIGKEWLDYEGSVMFVDPSGRGKDETTWAVIKMLHGMLFLTAIGASKDGYSDPTLLKVLKCAKDQSVNLILVEPNYGDGMFAQLLRAKSQVQYPVQIEDSPWAKAQKEVRIIDTLEPILNQHKLVVCSSVIEWDYESTEAYTQDDMVRMRLFYQMTRITRNRGALAHDDRIDAVAGAVAYWVDYMGRNTDKAVADRKQELLDQELARFMENALGSSFHSSPRWF
ncbi:phage terminase large subunit [Brucella pseudogrignonensis]|uniref:phage terminase large subunit n=1 Tax=Brucella pseudogrignonensis TaxID=419475 RepID=UPI000CFBFD6D|nr:phage terminase large subunit [Brucella pseudogrignonensis]MQP38759.1 phage terminase large subunit [Ochrobactrum sp. MYb237]PQZ43377.1 DNA maturase B [Brucella pseudogrignonensis]PRA43124.1 DNA maturase B [Brucella pseudogrignonensis]PRA72406.1 DNA maturase B [Brucella pseudogrignonensis]